MIPSILPSDRTRLNSTRHGATSWNAATSQIGQHPLFSLTLSLNDDGRRSRSGSRQIGRHIEASRRSQHQSGCIDSQDCQRKGHHRCSAQHWCADTTRQCPRWFGDTDTISGKQQQNQGQHATYRPSLSWSSKYDWRLSSYSQGKVCVLERVRDTNRDK